MHNQIKTKVWQSQNNGTIQYNTIQYNTIHKPNTLKMKSIWYMQIIFKRRKTNILTQMLLGNIFYMYRISELIFFFFIVFYYFLFFITFSFLLLSLFYYFLFFIIFSFLLLSLFYYFLCYFLLVKLLNLKLIIVIDLLV